jgi:hypothetical protein
MEQRNEKRTVQRPAKGQNARKDGALDGRHAYLIRITRESDQERALVAFRQVREAVQSASEDEFLVTGGHLEALRKAGVPFEDITEPVGNHGKEEAG